MLKNFTKLYNSEQKLRFLQEEYPNEGTQKTYGSLLQQLAKFENHYNKDLCDFSYSEAVDAFMGLRKKTFKSIDVAQTIVAKYVDWCEQQGYSKTNINAFKLMSKEDLKKFLHKVALEESYITRDRLYEIAESLYNPIDKAMLVLLFEGVKGRKEFEELRNLKASNVFPSTNTLIVKRDSGEKRIVRVDERTMEILKQAITQTEYYKGNGETEGIFAISPLKESSYLIKPSDNGKKAVDERIAVSSLNTRFRAFRKYTGINFLNPTLIFQSGLLEKCEIIDKENNGIEPDDFRGIYKLLKLDEDNWFNLKSMYEEYKKNE